jgi:ribosomal protein S18 acetylase RimI-like enzyme
MGASRDGRAVHALVQEAFGDIGDHHVLASYDAWAAAMLTPLRFDPELYLLAEQDGRLVGVCLTEARDAVGFVRQIAVGRADRGRGVAAALLIEAFRRHAAHGFTATVLGVDTTNTTGALRLYESAGMRVIEQLTRWERAART